MPTLKRSIAIMAAAESTAARQRRQEREIWCKAKKLDRADLPEDDVKREPERQVHHDANDRRGDRHQHGREGLVATQRLNGRLR